MRKNQDQMVLTINYSVEHTLEFGKQNIKFDITNDKDRKMLSTNLVEVIILTKKENKTLVKLGVNQGVTFKRVNVDWEQKYLVLFDSMKLLWLYRVKDSANIACMPLYGEVNEIKFNWDCRFVCLSMYDRRVLSLLIVDPDNKEHFERIKQLPSRMDLVEKKDSDIEANLNSIISKSHKQNQFNKHNLDSSGESTNSENEEEEKIFMYNKLLSNQRKRKIQTNNKSKERHVNEQSPSKYIIYRLLNEHKGQNIGYYRWE